MIISSVLDFLAGLENQQQPNEIFMSANNLLMAKKHLANYKKWNLDLFSPKGLSALVSWKNLPQKFNPYEKPTKY